MPAELRDNLPAEPGLGAARGVQVGHRLGGILLGLVFSVGV